MRHPTCIKLLREFLTLGILGTIGSVIGIGSGLNSLFGGGSNTPQPTGYAVPSGNTAVSNDAWQQLLSQMMGLAGPSTAAAQGPLQNAFQAIQGGITPGMQAGVIGAGQQAGGQYGNLANLAQLYQQMLGGQAQQAIGTGQQLLNTAFDPQQQLYNQLRQQVQDTSRASSSARGIGMGPESAGLENQAMNQFMTDWQNKQLGRQVQGAAGAAQQGALAGQDLGASMQMGGMQPGYTMQSAMSPLQAIMSAYQPQQQNALNYSNNMASIMNPLSGVQGNILQYMGMGSGMNQNAFNQANTAAMNTYNRQGAGTNALLTGIQGQYNPWTGQTQGGLANSGAGNWLNSMFGFGGQQGGGQPSWAGFIAPPGSGDVGANSNGWYPTGGIGLSTSPGWGNFTGAYDSSGG